MNAPRFQPGSRVRDFITAIPLIVVQVLPYRHANGERLYLTLSRAGKLRRLQERNLRPSTH